MGNDKFWDRNPGKFRIVVIVLSVLLVGMIGYNAINFASAIFSGTNYMQLPSKLYIKKSITLKNSKGSIDTITAGSFLLSINGNTVSNQEEYNNTLKNINKDSLVFFKVFHLRKAEYIKEITGNKFFDITSDTIFVKKSEIPEDFIKFLTTGSFIGYIMPDGATYRAGLKTGDLLLTIKDKEVVMDKVNPMHDGFDLEFYRFFRGLSKEEPIPYSILRNGEPLTFNVWLATFGISTTLFFVILCGLSYIVLGVYYGLKRPNFIAARLTAFGFIMIGFEIAISMGFSNPFYNTYNFIKIYLANASVFFYLPVLFHSLLYFPEKNEKFLNNKWHLRVTYLIAIVTLGMFSFWYFTGKDDGGVILFLLLANSLYYIIVRIIYSRKVTEKNKLSKKISIIWIIVFFSVFIFPVLNYLGMKWIPVLQEYIFLMLFLIPISYLYFTWRYRLLDIDFHLKRNIQYVLITILWKAILFGLFIFVLWKSSYLNLNFPNVKFSSSSIELLSIPLDSITNLFYNKLLFIVIAFISGAILMKAGKSGQNYFDKKFYRQKFDYKYAQEELVRLLQKKFTIESLARVIVEKVSSLVRVKISGIVFSGDGKKLWDSNMYCFDNRDSRVFNLNMEQKHFESIKGFKGAFSINYLPVETKNFLESNSFLNVIPVKVNERLLGALFIGENLSETPLKGEDFEFLSAVTTSISIAVENAFLYEELTKRERIKKELEIAHNIQVASLPQNVPVIPGLDIFATSIPALEVGGDFYDFLNGTANGLTIVMGDVSGKGTSAALYMSKIQGIFQTLHEFNLSPVKLLIRANHLLYKHIDSKSYITAVGASFDTENKTLAFARAGHLPLYYYNHNLKEIRKIQPCGMGLGLSEKNIFDYSIEEIKIEYSEGDIFLFVSDGVLEALNRAGEQFGETKMLELIKLNAKFDSKKMVNEILDSVKFFTSDTSQYDDITVVAVKAV
jgi:serine phosphatase RsbU (regulator of sigma subunit)